MSAKKQPAEHDFRCSFCGIDRRQVKVLISGPRVFICDDCVKICCDILVERRDAGDLKVIGEHAPVLADLDKRVHDLDLENGRMRSELALICDAVRRCLPFAARCMWCELMLDTEALAKEHVAVCDKHPAVIALANERSKRASEGQ